MSDLFVLSKTLFQGPSGFLLQLEFYDSSLPFLGSYIFFQETILSSNFPRKEIYQIVFQPLISEDVLFTPPPSDMWLDKAVYFEL
jgi:hypothetical protein